MSKEELILEIMKIALKINTREKNTIFFEYYGHCNLFRIEVDINGWVKNINPDFKKKVFLDLKNEEENIKSLKEILKYLKQLEDKKR